MKRFFLTGMAVVMMSVACFSRSKESRITDLMEHYNSYQGVECVRLGSLALSFAKMFADVEDEDEMELLSSVRKIIVMDLSEAAEGVQKRFVRDAVRVMGDMDGYELLMEAKDDDDSVSLYTMPDGNGGISEFVVLSQEDPALIFIKGDISAEMISRMVQDGEL